MITSYEIAEYINCPRSAYFLRTSGCSSVHIATQLREYLRIIQAFSSADIMQKSMCAPKESTLEETIAYTSSFLLQSLPHTNTDRKAQKSYDTHTQALSHAVISSDNVVAAYVPLCIWNASYKAWNFHFPTAAVGLKLEHKIHAANALVQCNKLHIPVAQVILQSIILDEQEHRAAQAYYTWHAQDISAVSYKYITEFQRHLDELTELIASEQVDDKSAWKQCSRRYCDTCKLEQTYTQDDVRTLRKSRHIVDDLIKNGITCMQDIPPEVELHTSARRQVEAVCSNKRLFFREEIRNFLHKLTYPRYYLDFESISTSVPFFAGIKAGGFVPFLFSVQWQSHSEDSIHTQLWGMPPASDKRKAMWQQLKSLLADAQSIIVYSRNFEDDMIRQLAQHAHEAHIGERLRTKIVDLQEIFFYLSAYDPAQKGRISLKTLAKIWLKKDYSAYKVQDGMEANYFFTAMTDEKNRSFEAIRTHSYTAFLYRALSSFDAKHPINISDIAEYCKYDTVVMIRLISLLERFVALTNTEHYT